MWEVDREWYQAAKTFHSGLKLLVGLLIFMLFTALFLDSAYAADVQSTYDGVLYGPSVVERPVTGGMDIYNQTEGCIVNAPNNFVAACFAVGGNPATLTSDQKALLSNANTGGDFYTFSQLFENYGGSFDTPSGWWNPNFRDTWKIYESVYGDDLYAATFTHAQLSGATADFNLVVSGGASGSGTNEYVMQICDDSLSTYTDSYWFVYGSNYARLLPKNAPATAKLTVSDAFHTRIENYRSNGRDVILSVAGTNSTNRNYNVFRFYAVPSGRWRLDRDTRTSSGNSYTFESIVITGDGNVRVDILPSNGVVLNDTTYTGGELNFVTNVNSIQNNSYSPNTKMVNLNGYVSWNGGWYCTSGYYVILYADGTTSIPQVPDSNWPDNPPIITPIHNDVPNPNNPVIDDQPIDPTPPQNPIYPPILNITEDTYTADLQGILDAMDAHCQHLRSALHTEMSNLWTVLSTKMTNDFATFRQYMTGQIGWLGDLISDEMEATRDYMQDLFEWLADEFDSTFSGTSYDDNTLISWLRKIYYRLGSGGVNTRPVDPVANPIDAGDWLSQLIANLFGALNALAGGLLTSVGSALDLMRTKFPFSLPWDLLAILALFEATPTAPDFDVPIYTVSSVGQLLQVGTWEIDLSDLSPYLEGIRWMQKICFVYFLAVHTKDWMDTLEKVVA